jgi:hypothetical protein
MMAEKRSKNFTPYEKSLLLELIKPFPVIFSKQKDAGILKAKEVAWLDGQQKFSQDENATKRDIEALKICCMNMTARAKKEDSERKKSIFETGGGPSTSEVSETSATIMEMMPQVFTSHNVCDDDYIPMKGEIV